MATALAALSLDSPVAALGGVTRPLAAALERLGIVTIHDLVRHYPYRYDDLRAAEPIAVLSAVGTGKRAPVGERNALGVITRLQHVRLRGRARSKTVAHIEDGTGILQAVWFGRPYLATQLQTGQRVFVRGRVEPTLTGAQMSVTRHRIVREGDEFEGELLPVYPQTAGLTSAHIQRLVRKALPVALRGDARRLDPLPASVNAAHKFRDARFALRAIHQPRSPAEATEARKHLVFEEFFLLAILAAQRRAERAGEAGPDIYERMTPAAMKAALAELSGALPFTLTKAQRRALADVAADFAKRSPMNRLLQGDVGSGKTAVAAGAVLLATRAGHQTAFMAPTEILAVQQFEKLQQMLGRAGVRSALVVGAMGKRVRGEILSELRHGDLDVVVGTHALLTDDVGFKRLGLVIIDEQHRFGVLQRAALRAKAEGHQPHTLVMTATPIPRTLAQSVYADLDVSVIDELPPGRMPIKTYVRGNDAKPKIFEFVREQVAKGRQAYVVCAAVDDSERALHSAVEQAEELRAGAFKGLRVGLLHGRMPVDDKSKIMRMLAQGLIDVLIATTVVEVGVDVPNASAMVVLDAQSFGLAQLHQLRGRVGRGSAKSYCILVADLDDEEVQARLAVLERTSDGFEIAEEDLKLRGPGELAGTRQTGEGGGLRLADLVRDFKVFLQAKAEAERIIAADPTLERPENAPLAAFLAAQDQAAALRMSS